MTNCGLFLLMLDAVLWLRSPWTSTFAGTGHSVLVAKAFPRLLCDGYVVRDTRAAPEVLFDPYCCLTC